jgi:mRNA interferase MazF
MVDLRRGDVVLVRSSADYFGKPRPAVVVQCQACLDLRLSITVCQFTSAMDADADFRPIVEPTAKNGLKARSAVQVDKIGTLYPENILGETKGRVSPSDMKNISAALAYWLGL